MKLLILACLLGFSAAAFLKDAAPAGSLRAALDMPDAYELDQLESDITTEVGKLLKEKRDHFLGQIIDGIENGKKIKEDLIEKAKKIGDELKEIGEDLGSKLIDKVKDLKEKVKNIKEGLMDKLKNKLKELLERLRIGKRDLNSVLDYLRQLQFKELLEDIKQKILSNETIQKIREYIRNFVTTNPILQKMKEAMLKLKDVDLRQLIKHLLHLDEDSRGTRSLKELWEKIKNFFKDLHIQIKEKFMKFGEWVRVNLKEKMEQLKDTLKEKHQIVKVIAEELLEHGKKASKEVWEQALEFFEQYKNDLGALWDQLKEQGKEIINQH